MSADLRGEMVCWSLSVLRARSRLAGRAVSAGDLHCARPGQQVAASESARGNGEELAGTGARQTAFLLSAASGHGLTLAGSGM
ncbi:hypothetical protein [Streptomyces sp. NPDC057052]|uniref:hypothetical protein n=1 Tax=Streptomyces sp. NPDC057052 TaxID=3346010 RepID=UPI0036359F6C